MAVPYSPPGRNKRNQIRERLLQTDNSQGGWNGTCCQGEFAPERVGPPVPPAPHGEVRERHPGEGELAGSTPTPWGLSRDCSQQGQGPRQSGTETQGGGFVVKNIACVHGIKTFVIMHVCERGELQLNAQLWAPGSFSELQSHCNFLCAK